MSTLDVRRAGPGDLDAIAALTRHLRHRLGEWEPGFWRPAAGADELHRCGSGHLLGTGEPPPGSSRRAREVVGCAFSVRQPGQWFVDDVAVAADGDWADAGCGAAGGGGRAAGADLRAPGRPRPGRSDRRRRVGARVRLPAAGGPGPGLGVQQAGPAEPGDPPPAAGPPAPPHTFGGPFDPAAPGALVVAARGSAVGSPAVAAPPVYDPGGTTCVVDRVAGPDLPALLDAVTAGPPPRRPPAGGGVRGRRRRPGALDERRFRHPVEVFRAPS